MDGPEELTALEYGDATTRQGIVVSEDGGVVEILVRRASLWDFATGGPFTIPLVIGATWCAFQVAGVLAAAGGLNLRALAGVLQLLPTFAVYVGILVALILYRGLGAPAGPVTFRVGRTHLLVDGYMNDPAEVAVSRRMKRRLLRATIASVRGDLPNIGLTIRGGDGGAFVEVLASHPPLVRRAAAYELRRALGMPQIG